jgi:hypothetical protein
MITMQTVWRDREWRGECERQRQQEQEHSEAAALKNFLEFAQSHGSALALAQEIAQICDKRRGAGGGISASDTLDSSSGSTGGTRDC